MQHLVCTVKRPYILPPSTSQRRDHPLNNIYFYMFFSLSTVTQSWHQVLPFSKTRKDPSASILHHEIFPNSSKNPLRTSYVYLISSLLCDSNLLQILITHNEIFWIFTSETVLQQLLKCKTTYTTVYTTSQFIL